MRTIFPSLFFAFIILLVTSCDAGNPSIIKVKREGEPDADLVSPKNREMNEAIAESKRQFHVFLAALQDQDSLTYNFAVKVPFPTPDGDREHLWLTEVSLEGDSLYGLVSNEPIFTKEVTLGQLVATTPEQITDWNYTKAGKLIGGYTIRVLRNKMTAEEKEQLDASLGVEIE